MRQSKLYLHGLVIFGPSASLIGGSLEDLPVYKDCSFVNFFARAPAAQPSTKDTGTEARASSSLSLAVGLAMFARTPIKSPPRAAIMAILLCLTVTCSTPVSGCGTMAPYTDSQRLTGRTCMTDVSTKTVLEKFYVDMLLQQDPRPLRMLVKSWDTHRIHSMIAQIIISEVLGYPSIVHCTTEDGATAGSFKALSTDVREPAKVDLDMELWAASAINEYQASSGKYVNGGTTYQYARSGLFLRPSPEHYERMLTHGRVGSALLAEVIPYLPTLTQVRNMSFWCATGGADQHCDETPNRHCYDRPDECRVLLKQSNGLDKGIVEQMIANSSLPLIIVYTGSTWDFLAQWPNMSFLFYYWEPARVVGPGSNWIRVAFDDPIFCEGNVSFTVLPRLHACDFQEGSVHKGYSHRVRDLYTDVAYMMEHYQLSSQFAYELEAGIHERQLSVNASPFDTFDVACEWLRKHPSVWHRWLRDPLYRPGWKHVAPIATVVVVVLLALAWVLMPFYMPLPAPGGGHQWFQAAGSLKVHWLGLKLLVGAPMQQLTRLVRSLWHLCRLCRPTADGAPSQVQIISSAAARAPAAAQVSAASVRWQDKDEVAVEDEREEQEEAPSASPSKKKIFMVARSMVGRRAESEGTIPARGSSRASQRFSVRSRLAAIRNEYSRRSNKLHALKTASLQYQARDYPRSADVAVGFIQGFVRYSDYDRALLARMRVAESLADGIQFAQSQCVLHGMARGAARLRTMPALA